MIKTLKALLSCTTIFLSSISFAETIQCKVVGVNNGDTFSCLTDKEKTIEIRMSQIDAPELDQPYGLEAKQILFKELYGKSISFYPQEKDSAFGWVVLNKKK